VHPSPTRRNDVGFQRITVIAVFKPQIGSILMTLNGQSGGPRTAANRSPKMVRV
jgi:hypothetical protein